MNSKKVILILLIFMFFSAPVVFARAEYNSLPKLDGKVDSANPSMREELLKQKEAKEPIKPDVVKKDNSQTQIITQQDIENLPVMHGEKIASNSPARQKKGSIVAIDSPKLDKLTPDIGKSHLTDSIRFAKYEKDLNKVLEELAVLSQTIQKGTQVQLFSARATSIKFLNDIFVSKYEQTPESQLDSYKLLQDTVKSAVFVRDYWIDSNKIKYNQKGVPDEIIKTKFLKISTNVDKLIELTKINNVLNEE